MCKVLKQFHYNFFFDGITLKAENIKYSVTPNPSTANPGDILRVKIPKLDENVLIIPNSVHLVFDLVIEGHTNNIFVNNINRNIIKSFKLLYGGETIQELQRYDLFKSFQDLFLPKEKREYNLLNYGISSKNIRKYRADAGDKLTTGEGYDKNEEILADVHKNKYKIKLGHEILNSHGVFYPFVLHNSFLFELKLCSVDDLVNYSSTTKPPNFKLKNIELEYTCVTSPELAFKTESSYKIGKSFYYENTILEKVFTISRANDSLINLQINLPRKSLTGLLLLFVEDFTAGLKYSEKFANPYILGINTTINGIPNRLNNKGYSRKDFFENLLKRYNYNLSEKDFFNNKFGIWLDFRSFPDSKNEIHGSGLKLDSTNGIQISLKRSKEEVVVILLLLYLW